MNLKHFNKKTFLIIVLLSFFVCSKIAFSGDLKFNTSGGNVGIGTANPVETLEIMNANSTGNLTTRLRVTDTTENPEIQLQYGTGTDDHWSIYNLQSNDSLNVWRGSNVLTILQNGNVGIGTIAPSSKLDVSGGINASTSVSTPLVFNQNDLTLQSGTGDVILNANNGNVGIGTASPDSDLHVVGGVCVEAGDTNCVAAAGDTKSTRLFQSGVQVIDTLAQGYGMNITGSATVLEEFL